MSWHHAEGGWQSSPAQLGNVIREGRRKNLMDNQVGVQRKTRSH
jgi:hypothetical protein